MLKKKEKEQVNPRDRFVEIMSSFNSHRRKIVAIETEGLNIPIAYSYDNAGLKKAQAELSKFTSTTSAGIVKSRNSFDNIKNIYNSVADGITKDNAKNRVVF